MAYRRIFFAAILAMVLATVGALAYYDYVKELNRSAAPKKGPSDREAAQMLAPKNFAVAGLDEKDYAAAIPLLVELSTEGTGEPFGPRNLAIARLSALGKIDANAERSAYLEATTYTQAAVALENRLEPTGPMRHFLSAKLAGFRQDVSKRIANLHLATRTASGDPVIWFELYRAQKNVELDKARQDGENALKMVREALPDNLYVLFEWLQVQAHRKDPRIVETLAEAGKLLAPFIAELSPTPRDAKVPLAKLTTAASTAAKAGDWTQTARDVSVIEDACRKLPVVQADRQRIDRGLDWFELSDFSDPFYQEHHLTRALPKEPAAVRFRETPLDGLPPEANDVRDAKFVDLESDGKLQIALLRSGSFEIYGRAPSGGRWTKIASAPIKLSGFDHFTTVPLGTTTANAPPGASRNTAPPGANTNTTPPGASVGSAKAGGSSANGVASEPDFVLYGPAGVSILQSRLDAGTKSRTLQTVQTGKLTEGTTGARSLVTIDLDHDGSLDLVVARAERIAVWLNRGRGVFEDVTGRSELSQNKPIKVQSLAAVDWDHNFDMDVFFASAGEPTHAGYLYGIGEGRFHVRSLDSLPEVFQKAVTFAVLDADSNGSWDLLAAGPAGMALLRTASLQLGVVASQQPEPVSDFPAAGLLVLDFDNDGCPDVLAWNKESVQVFHGGAAGRFESVADVMPSSIQSILSADCGDFDSDGGVDLLIVTGGGSAGRVQLLQNDGGNKNNWIDVRLDTAPLAARASTGIQIPPAGIGSMVQLRAETISASQIAWKSVTHFGLGSLPSADVMRVRWTTGAADNSLRPFKNQVIVQRPAPSRQRPIDTTPSHR